MAFLDEIAARLVTQSIGVIGSTLFISSAALIPPGDGPFVLLKETGGTGSLKTQNDTATERPTAQISARARSAITARAKCQAAYVALGGHNGLYNATLSGTSYVSITARQLPTDIGLDAEKRAMFAFNIDVEKYPS